MRHLLIGFVFSMGCLGQTFEVATIKPAPSSGPGMMRIAVAGGPGTPDPGLYKCENCTVSMLVRQAWDVQRYEAPGVSLDEERFDVSAKVPAGATKEQFRLMLRNLLAERFKVTFHQERREMQIYEMVVAKGGSKLKEAAPVDPNDAVAEPGPLAGPGRRMQMGKDGFPSVPALPGRPLMMIMNGRARSVARAVTMDDLAKFLVPHVGGKPVHDATGLRGKFDYTLTFAPDMSVMPPPPGGEHMGPPPVNADAEPLPNIFIALQEQLGLKLESKKGMVDTLFIDHAEKMPTEN